MPLFCEFDAGRWNKQREMIQKPSNHIFQVARHPPYPTRSWRLNNGRERMEERWGTRLEANTNKKWNKNVKEQLDRASRVFSLLGNRVRAKSSKKKKKKNKTRIGGKSYIETLGLPIRSTSCARGRNQEPFSPLAFP